MLDNVKPCLKVHTGIAALAQDKSLAEINDTPNERISDSQGDPPLKNSGFLTEILQVGFSAKNHLKHVFMEEKKYF